MKASFDAERPLKTACTERCCARKKKLMLDVNSRSGVFDVVLTEQENSI